MRLSLVLVLFLCPLAAAQEKPKSDPAGIDELIAKLADVRKQRGELENQERSLISQLRERMLAQQQKLAQMGVSLEAPIPLPPVTSPAPPVQPPPSTPPQPQPPRAPATLAEELTAAYQADKAVRRGGPDDLRSLARIFENAGQALDKARPPTVGHLRNGIEVIIRVQLKQQLPSVVTLLQRHLALKLPDDNTALTPATGVACKFVLLEVASALTAITP